MIRRQIEARDLQMANPYSKDAQVQGIRNARRYIGDRLGRVAAAAPHPGPRGGPADRRQAAHADPQDPRRHPDRPATPAPSASTARPVAGLYAAGEVAGFGGGGVHGYNALEGTFLGGCLFSGRAAGSEAARRTA